jgi:hypothetical protein
MDTNNANNGSIFVIIRVHSWIFPFSFFNSYLISVALEPVPKAMPRPAKQATAGVLLGQKTRSPGCAPLLGGDMGAEPLFSFERKYEKGSGDRRAVDEI